MASSIMNPQDRQEEATAQAALTNFVYLQQHRVLICREHGYAVGLDLKRHMKDHHPRYKRIARDAVLAEFQNLPRIEPHLAHLPTADGPPIEGLLRPQKAYKCFGAECAYISSSRDTIMAHSRKAHHWKHSKETPIHWTELFAQSFCLAPGKQRWFPVSVGAGHTKTVAAPASANIMADLANLKSQALALRAREKQEMDVLADLHPTDQTGWWKRTQWVAHLQNSSLRYLAHAARLPGRDEPELQVVATAVDELIEDCVTALVSAPLVARRLIKGVGEDPHQQPLSRLQPDTQKRYANYWKQMICYMIRVAQSEGSVSVHGDDVTGPIVEQDTMKDARRLFPWTTETRDKAKTIIQAVARGSGVKESIMEFSRCVVIQHVCDSDFANPVIHFMAVLGINANRGTMRECHEASPILAGVVYCVRVISLELLLPSTGPRAPPEVQNFRDQRRTYLQDGSMGLLPALVSLLAYAKKIGKSYSNVGSVFWEGGNRVMVFQGARIAMDHFRAMVENAIHEAEALLWVTLMSTPRETDRLELDLHDLSDNMSSSDSGHSFVYDPKNDLATAHVDVTARRLSESEHGKKMRRDGTWHPKLTADYLRQVDLFRKLLLFCVHVTGGQPARGTEILSIRHKNGCLRTRNIFLLDGYVMTVTFYNKTDSQWDSPKIIPRFLPWRVGQLLASYLVYIQPLAALMGDAIGSGTCQSEYVWAHKSESADKLVPWDTRKLTEMINTRSGKDLGAIFGTLDYRHIAIGIGRKYVGQHFAKDCFTDEMDDVQDEEMAIEDPLEMSAGRGTATGAARYAVRSDLVQHLTQDNIDTLRPLSQSWHSFLGLESRKGDLRSNQKRHAPAMEATLAKKTKSGWTDWPTTPTISTAYTAVPTMPSRQMQSPPLHVFDVAEGSSAPPIPSSSTGPSRQVLRVTPDSQQRDRAVRKALGLADLALVAYKSPEQKQALERIMNNADPALVVVLPTGGGKSLLFTAPACLENSGMTIVVIPYRQLITETVNDAVARGIEAIEWTPMLQAPKKLVVVSADNLTPEFFHYTTRMTEENCLRRVFLDECHLAITAHSWRTNLIHLERLRSIHAPTIMLTATLPLHMEREFKSTMLLTQDPCWLIRASTARKSTRYMVKSTVADGKLMEEATKVCKEQMVLLQPEAKMIVFCRTKAECRELAEALGCEYFFADSPHNTKVIQSWIESGGCVVATSSLGTGVSYKDVALTVHVGMPYGLIDFAQESGRAGRGGEVVASFILLEENWCAYERARLSSLGRVRSVDELEMMAFVYTEGCRRLVLGKYFDGDSPQDCQSGDMERCDRCCSGVSDWTRSQKEMSAERHMVQETLNHIAVVCPVCWVTSALGSGPKTGRAHKAWSQACPQRETVNCTGSTGGKLSMSESDCDSFRKSIRHVKAANACHRCGISQKLCHTREDGGQCQWPRIAPAILRLAIANDAGREIITKAGYIGDMNDWDAYALWLGQEHRQRLWRELVGNSMVVLSRFLLHCERQTKPELWDFEYANDEVGDLMEEIWSSGAVAPTQVAGVREAHAPERDAELAESCTHDADGEFAEIDIDDGYQPILPRQPLPCNREPRDMLRSPGLDKEEIKRLAISWSNICVVCKVNGKEPRNHHHWTKCDSVQGGQEKMTDALAFLRGIPFAKFVHCNFCYRPQAICEIWNRSLNNRGLVAFNKTPGAQCSFGMGVWEAAAAFLAFGQIDNLEEWRRDGDLVAKQQQLGKKYKRGELEFSGLFVYFYKWA